MVVILRIELKMKRLLIIGAGGFGREVLHWALDVLPEHRDWKVGGFLDANPSVLEAYDCGLPILADPLHYSPQEDDCFICAIGHPLTKLRVCRYLKERGAQFITLIHPTAIIGDRCTIGAGCVFCPGAVITTDVKIGDFVMMNLQSTIGHDAVVADGCTLSPHADVNGFALLGEGVFLGSHAVVLPGATIGDYAIVGAGSVVLKKVKAGATVMGVPAKQIAGF
jgi:sugar O-acyltransferase (sialic acid O-acetyltransferase NeuD family)